MIPPPGFNALQFASPFLRFAHSEPRVHNERMTRRMVCFAAALPDEPRAFVAREVDLLGMRGHRRAQHYEPCPRGSVVRDCGIEMLKT
jgi:hypothetical protein